MQKSTGLSKAIVRNYNVEYGRYISKGTLTKGMLKILIIITVVLIPLYIWYASYVLNNLGYFRSRQIENLHFGAVFGGFLIIVFLIYMIIMLITE